MKELLKKIIFPYKTIKELEKEIKNQDKQYTTLQNKLTKEECKRKLYERENIELEIANTKHLETLREQRKIIRELRNELRDYQDNSKKSTRK